MGGSRQGVFFDVVFCLAVHCVMCNRFGVRLRPPNWARLVVAEDDLAVGDDKEKTMKALLKKFVTDERGLETVEWGVIAALIVLGLVGTITLLGGHVNDRFTALDAAVAS